MRIIALIALLIPVGAFAASLDFKRDGKLVQSWPIEKLQSGRVGAVKAEEIDLYNAWRQERKTYVGYDFFKVLDAVYGKAWRDSAMVRFVALDGYISHSDTKPMLKAAARRTGLLAFKEKGAQGFTPFKHGDKLVDPGPFYLLWSGYKETDHAAYSDVLKWPYQLKEIDVADKGD